MELEALAISKNKNRKYSVGEEVGPYKHKILGYSKNYSKDKKVLFLCGICHNNSFISRLSDVTRTDKRSIHSCGCINNNYIIGNRYGKYQHKLIEIIKDKMGKNSYGIFLCGACNKNTFKARVDTIKYNHKLSCGCLNDLSGEKFGKLTVLCPTNKRDNTGNIIWKCQCDCDNFTICYVPTSSLKSGNTTSCGCVISKGENKIQNILQQEGIKFYKQYKFPDLVSSKNYQLKFDFYLPDYNICIEYDGIQHFSPTFYTHDDFEIRKHNDKLKTIYCQENNIKLIRIPYTDFDKINKKYLEERLAN